MKDPEGSGKVQEGSGKVQEGSGKGPEDLWMVQGWISAMHWKVQGIFLNLFF